MRTLRQRIAAALPAVLVATLLTVVAAPEAASAAPGPSQPLPDTPSTPVSQQVMAARDQDQASRNALTGDQRPGTAPKKSGGGTPTATPLSPSATWQVSAQTGDFTWAYPLRVPPAPGGLEPDLTLSYASSAVDGRTSATNNQSSWVGDGWDLSPGFVERTYGACAEDDMGGTTPPKVGDLCWRSDNAVASYNGGGGELICCDTDGRWRARHDDGSRIERLTGAGNGDADGEYWKITTTDGTQFFFGSRADARSTWTVPVFGDDAGEPCHAATFAASHCVQAWRWNLDRVVDRNGNEIVYGYDAETNAYGLNGRTTAVPYVRGGTLRTVEYGLRAGQAASGRVEFTVADRCVPGSDCRPGAPLNWPDVPWDEKCDTATCTDKQHSPTFWSTKRLAKVTTQVRQATGFVDVDSWTLDHQFPKTGDGEDPSLWLKSVVHTGHVGGTAAMPAVTFEGTMLPNRVYKVDGLAPLNRYRVTGVISETGGFLSVKYADPECVQGGRMPEHAHTNTLRCFPVRWAKEGQPERTDYFHKYVVESTTQSDRISANTQQVTTYEYVDGAGWHYDTSEFTKPDKKTWDEFRGYAVVRIRTGTPNDPSGPVGKTEQRFYRGMHGDKQPTGTRTASVTPSEGEARVDEDWLRGTTLETITYDGDSDRVVDKTIETPTWGDPTATRGDRKAYLVRTGATETWTALAAGGWRTTRTETTYDDRGLVAKVNDLGDKATAADDRCTRTWYARNTDRWLLAFASRTETVAVACDKTPSFPGDAISDLRNVYDGREPGDAPTHGNVTRGEELKARPASGPEYVTTVTSVYDAHGRVVELGDAEGRVTKTTFTPAVGGPVTGTVTTNALGHTTTKTLEPAWGLPLSEVDPNRRRTETAYDPLGRVVEVWLPNRGRAEQSGNARFSYLVRGDGPTVVTTSRLNANGNYVTTKELYDGLLRLRQTQEPAAGGGRLLTDTRYDSQGRPYKSTQPYFNDAALDDELWVASDVEVPGLNVTRYDGAGREVARIYQAGARERWRTTTAYGGDRVHVTPPRGGTATTAVNDARGHTVELRQYQGGTPTGAYDTTTYGYSKAGRRTSTTDPGGNVWRFHYDLRGHQVSVEDPDKGTSTMTYDDSGRPLTATDGRGVTLAYTYDELGRMRTVSSGGTKLAEWTYDTATKGKGQLAATTRYVDGAAFSRVVASYTALYHPSETRIVIPESPRTQTLAGTYTTYSALNADGTPYNMTLPAVGDLPKETLHQEYSELSQPIGLTGGPEGAGTVEYVTGTGYTRYGEVERVQLGQVGKRVWLSYYYDDSTRRLSRSIVDAEVSRPMQADVTYRYDDAGNILSVANTPLDLPHDVQCFRYDHLRRLTHAWTPAADCAGDPATAALDGPAPYRHSYTYDAVGNRVTERTGGTLRTYGYPKANAHQLTSVTTTDAAGAEIRRDEYGYDKAGNTLTRPGQRLDWDAEGKLATVTEGDETSRFVYDADGERLIREDPTGITAYLDGQELRLDKATGELSGTRYYQHGGMTVAVRTGAGVTWQAGDHQDTAQVAVDAASQKVTQRRQTPFGAPRGAAVPWVGDKGFVGGTTDTATGLTHLGARQYDPLLGRFISVDPVMDTADAQQMHGYTYSNNNPVTYSDPTGMLFGWIKKAASAVGNAVVNTVKEAINHPLDFIANVTVGIAVGALVAGACAVTVGVGCVVAGAIIGGAASGMVGASQAANRQGRAATPGELAMGAGVGAVAGGLLHGAAVGVGKVANHIKGGRGGASEVAPASPAAAAHTPANRRALEEAALARDLEMDKYVGKSFDETPATFTAGVDPATGRWAVGWSDGKGGCAECMVAAKLGRNQNEVLYTYAYGYRMTPRMGEGFQGQNPRVIGARDKVEIPICAKCQERSNPWQYPKDVKYAPGARWDTSPTYQTRDGRTCPRGGGMCAI